MDPLVMLAAAVSIVLGSVGFLVGRGLERSRHRKERAAAQDEASRILGRAEQEADNSVKTATLRGKEEVYRLRESWETEESRRREETERLERRLSERSDSLDKKFDRLNEREAVLDHGGQELEQRGVELEGEARRLEIAAGENRKQLEAMAGLSAEEAKKLLTDGLEDEARAEAANTLRAIKDEAQRNSDREAKKIIALAIQRMAADQTAEMTVSRGPATVRRDEGADHRARGQEHPRVRAGHRDRRHYRRYARSGHPLGVQPRPARNRADLAGQADRRWAHPSGAHRGDRREKP